MAGGGWREWLSTLHGVCCEPPSPDACREFSVNTQRNLYRCFRCGSGDNALELWGNYRELSLYAAA